MTYLATQMAQPNIGGSADPFQDLLLPLEMPDHQSTYGYAGYGTIEAQADLRSRILTSL